MKLRSAYVPAVLALVLLVVVVTTPAAAGDLGIRGGLYLDDDDPFVGIEWLADLRGHWDVNPNLEVIFPDGADRFSLNLDFHRDFHSDRQVDFWLGAGAGVILTDPDNRRRKNEVDSAINLLAGVGARRGPVRPYGQLKVVLSDDSEAVVMAGLRF